MTLAQNRDPSFFTCQPSLPTWPSAAARFNSSCSLPESVFVGIEQRHVLADDLVALVAVNAFRSRIPGDNLSVHIQQEQRIVLHPSRNALGESLSASARLASCRAAPEDGAPATRSLWRCTRLPAESPSGPTSWSVPSCSPSSRKALPALRNHRLEAGLRKIIQTAADDLFARKTQELAGADTGLPVMAIVVGDQNGRGRMEYDRPEQQLRVPSDRFPRANWQPVAERPLLFFLLCPVDPGSRRPGERLRSANRGKP